MYVYKCMYICTYIYIYIYAFICIHINTLAGNDDRYAFKPNGKKILCLALAEARGKYIYMCVCVYIHARTYMYIYIYTRTCIYMYIHLGNDDRYSFKSAEEKGLCLSLAEARGSIARELLNAHYTATQEAHLKRCGTLENMGMPHTDFEVYM